jgi:hypothetical protein
MRRLPRWLCEELIPLTVPEVRRLVWHLVWDRVADEVNVAHRSV